MDQMQHAPRRNDVTPAEWDANHGLLNGDVAQIVIADDGSTDATHTLLTDTGHTPPWEAASGMRPHPSNTSKCWPFHVSTWTT